MLLGSQISRTKYLEEDERDQKFQYKFVVFNEPFLGLLTEMAHEGITLEQ